MMTVQQASLIVGIIASIFLPMLFTMVRLTVKWTKVEAALTRVSERIELLVKDKDRTHQEIATTIREDRKTIAEQLIHDRESTDRRLRWLEERLWKEK